MNTEKKKKKTYHHFKMNHSSLTLSNLSGVATTSYASVPSPLRNIMMRLVFVASILRILLDSAGFVFLEASWGRTIPFIVQAACNFLCAVPEK